MREVTLRGMLFVDSTGLVLLCETMKLSKPPQPGRGQTIVRDLDYSAVRFGTRDGYRWAWSGTVEVRGVMEDGYLRAVAPALPVAAQ